MMTNDDLKDIEPTQDSLSDPESGDDLVLNEYHPKRTKKFIILVACVAAFGGLIFGYDIAGAGATFVMTGKAKTMVNDSEQSFVFVASMKRNVFVLV